MRRCREVKGGEKGRGRKGGDEGKVLLRLEYIPGYGLHGC